MELFSSYTGPDFLVFYCILLVTAVAAGLWIPATLREAGRRGEVEDVEEVAVLTGGADRLNVTVLSSLFAKGALRAEDKNRLSVARSEAADNDAEKAVLAKVGDFKLAEARKSIAAQAERVEARLIRRGLMMDKGARIKLRMLSVLPYVALIFIGLYRQQAGAAQGEPTGLLIALMVATATCAIIRLGTGNPRTKAGNAAIMELEEQSSRLKRAPQASEAGFAVALFGTAVLVGTPWEPVHAMRQASGGGEGGTSLGDGDSGCGGGGCGGCGG